MGSNGTLLDWTGPRQRTQRFRGTYQFSINPTTGKLNYVLVDQNVFNSLLFPPTVDDTTTLIGGAEHAGDMKPADMTTFLFNNTFLFSDVTAVSHELMAIYSDPFVNNATPIWLAPNGLCQANLESGDVIEGLTNATFPMTMNGYT